MIRVAIADDHPLLRLGVRELLAAADDIEVVGEATSGRGAVELARSVRPDVVVIDLTMPYDDAVPMTRTSSTGIDAIAAMRTAGDPLPAAVVLSVHGEPGVVRAALRAGASGYVLKESVMSDLLLAVRAAASGSLYLSGEVAAVLSAPADAEPELGDTLSPREREVAQLVVDGLSTKQIASKLATSPKTVEKQRRNAMRKLGAPNVASLVRAMTGEGR